VSIQVEKIVSHKKDRGKYKFRIRWAGFTADEDTWEPEENLIGDYCQSLLAAYKASIYVHFLNVHF
jgi:hypothetical protein